MNLVKVFKMKQPSGYSSGQKNSSSGLSSRQSKKKWPKKHSEVVEKKLINQMVLCKIEARLN